MEKIEEKRKEKYIIYKVPYNPTNAHDLVQNKLTK